MNKIFRIQSGTTTITDNDTKKAKKLHKNYRNYTEHHAVTTQ